MSTLPEPLPATSKEDYQIAKAGLVPATIDEALTVAKAFAAGGLFPDIKNAGQALVKIMAGAEYGLTPVAAMNSFHIVQGKLGMHYSLIGARIKSSEKYNYRVIAKTNDRCEVAFFEHGEEIGREVFTAEDAKRQATQNMGKFPATMLFARALTNGARTYCSEVFNGNAVYTPEELQEEHRKGPDAVAGVGDQIMARLQPAPPADSITTEGIDVPDETPYEPYMGPTVVDEREEQGQLI
jgi:hypothetical protein